MLMLVCALLASLALPAQAEGYALPPAEDPALAESAARSVASAYAKAFPALAEAFSAHICHSADGIQP